MSIYDDFAEEADDGLDIVVNADGEEEPTSFFEDAYGMNTMTLAAYVDEAVVAKVTDSAPSPTLQASMDRIKRLQLLRGDSDPMVEAACVDILSGLKTYLLELKVQPAQSFFALLNSLDYDSARNQIGIALEWLPRLDAMMVEAAEADRAEAHRVARMKAIAMAMAETGASYEEIKAAIMAAEEV